MKVVIAGGRDFYFCEDDYSLLEYINERFNFTEIVSGGCLGADEHGELFAVKNNIPIKYFKANWNKYGKAAGPIRNKMMAEYADAIILFPGGRGTANMRKCAKDNNLKILFDAKDHKQYLKIKKDILLEE